MEGVWLKTEPVDDNKFDPCLSIKLEPGFDINVNAEPMIIISTIKQDESENALEEVERVRSTNCDPKQKPDAMDGSVKKVAKKTRDKIHQRKQLNKISTAKSDTEKVEKKSGDIKCKQRKGKASASEKKAYICEKCGKEFTGRSGLNRHKLLHSGIKPYVCPKEHCGAAFSQSSTLKSHIMSHTGERRFFCEECGQGFSSKYHMQIHQRSHSGERPFICVECGQGFARKQSLTRHLLEHSGEKPFKCDECGMRFFESILLKSHKKTHTANGKPFICVECGQGFYHKTSLNAHKRAHLTVRPFGCDICGKRFTQRGTLNVHKVIHSDTRPFECEECGLRFTQKFTLKTHRMKQHGLHTTSLKQQQTIHTGLPVTGSEAEIVSRNDTILPVDCESVPSSSNAKLSMDSTPKSMFPFNRNNFNESKETFTEESVLKVQQPEEATEIAISSPSTNESSKSSSSLSENELILETMDNESTESEDKFAADRSIVQQPERIDEPMSVDRINEETPTSESLLFDIWKPERTPLDGDNVNVTDENTKNRRKKPNSIKKACDVSVPFSCDKCERKFSLVGALKNHQRSHRRPNKAKKKLAAICDECGKIFTTKHHLVIHKRIHSGSTPYSCQECGMSFIQLSNFRSHQRVHSGERPFACEACGLRFAQKNTLQRHQLTHSEVRSYECEACGKKFKYASSINRHKLSHKGEKKFGCDICGKTFTEKSYIKFHLRIHTGYKPFACDQCPSKFIDKSQLTQHKGYSHRGVDEPSPRHRRKLMKMMKMVDNLL